MKPRHSSLTAVVLASTVLLTSCGEPTSKNEDTQAESGSTSITVYTSEPEEKADEINAAFNEEFPDIEVKVYRAGTGDLNARISSEKKSGDIQADVFWAADAPTFENYADDGDLIQLADVDSNNIIDEAKDDENFYVGTRIIPTVIANNTDELAEGEAPRSWADLTDPKYKDKLIMPNPAVSGAAAFNASAWKNNSDLGETWLEDLGQNSPMIAESNGPTSQEIASGSRPVGVVVDYLVRDLADKGSPVALSYPSEGAPYISEPAGVFKDSKEQEAAQKYINFLLSKKAQKIAVEQSYLPVRKDVGTPAATPELEDIELMDQDLEKITKDKNAAVEAFQKAVSS